MTDTWTDRIATPGVWYFTNGMTAPDAVEFTQRVEQLGYSMLWLPETTGRDPFAHIGFLGAHTEKLIFGTGIANIFHRHPGVMAQCGKTLAEQTGDRFVLGIGVSHAPIVSGVRGLDYSKPLSTMREYLQGMDESPYSGVAPAEPPPVLVAALGPKMLELAGTAADGAHPYWTTPEHTATARETMGPDALLCVEQKVVLSTDPELARTAANGQIDNYVALPNYRNNWLRLGFTDDEINKRANRFVDGVVAWGDVDALRDRVQSHYDAGATHVCIQPVNPDGSTDPHWEALEALAPGLS